MSTAMHQFVSGLKHHSEETREKAVRDLNHYVSTELSEVSADDLTAFMDDFNHQIFEMVSSADVNEKKGGILAIGACAEPRSRTPTWVQGWGEGGWGGVLFGNAWNFQKKKDQKKYFRENISEKIFQENKFQKKYFISNICEKNIIKKITENNFQSEPIFQIFFSENHFPNKIFQAQISEQNFQNKNLTTKNFRTKYLQQNFA